MINENTITGRFDSIAHRYDLANHIISLGMDTSWRSRLVSLLPEKENIKMLDIACGTANIAIAAGKRYPGIASITAIDASKNMLKAARKKVQRAGLNRKIRLINGSMTDLPFPNELFDCVSIAFGIRNTSEKSRAVSEMVRVLKPGASLIIMEFSIPSGLLLRIPYEIYMKFLVPLIAGFITGHREPYSYLYSSIREFSSANEVPDLLKSAQIKYHKPLSLAGGAVWIYKAFKY